LRTIQAGIDLASTTSRDTVWVAGGTYAENVTLATGVGVWAGYSADFSSRDITGFPTTIEGQSRNGDPYPGAVNAVDVAGGAAGSTTLDGFVVRGYDTSSTDSIQSTYAIYVRDSDGTLAITNNAIAAGDAPSSRPASASGDPGLPGDPGGTGVDAIDMFTTYGTMNHGCVDEDHAQAGGAAGFSWCAGATGGVGGGRSCPAWDSTAGETVAPGVPESGTAGGSGAAGGAGGHDAYLRPYSNPGWPGDDTCDDLANVLTFSADLEGAVGSPGGPGGDGAGGAGCSDGAGTVANGFWRPLPAVAGVAGTAGGGGGGGGAGAGNLTSTDCADSPHGDDVLGPTGGGGGGGGCGGGQGAAGLGGGGSFALFVNWFNSTPTTAPTISGNAFQGGIGGGGGAGGNGADGGLGGTGGPGGAGSPTNGGGFVTTDPRFPAWDAGDGGPGGIGGVGGGGGGGCGGPAYSLYVWGEGTLDVSGWATGNTFLALGSGGAGGAGGTSSVSGGAPGASGAAANTNIP
jgi:hypothetical protein